MTFFFRAEDGIRDADVTGVQTCALPICVGSYRERWITYRDAETYKRIVQGGPLYRSEERRVGKGWRCCGGLDIRYTQVRTRSLRTSYAALSSARRIY